MPGGGVNARPERPLLPVVEIEPTGADRGDGGGLQRLLFRHRRQDAGQTACQHGLAGAGWPDHQQAVAARGRDLERTLGVMLPADVGEIGGGARRRQGWRGRERQESLAVEVGADFEQVACRMDRGGTDERALRRVERRDDQGAARARGLQRGREDAADGAQFPGQRQFADGSRRAHAAGGS